MLQKLNKWLRILAHSEFPRGGIPSGKLSPIAKQSMGRGWELIASLPQHFLALGVCFYNKVDTIYLVRFEERTV